MLVADTDRVVFFGGTRHMECHSVPIQMHSMFVPVETQRRPVFSLASLVGGKIKPDWEEVRYQRETISCDVNGIPCVWQCFMVSMDHADRSRSMTAMQLVNACLFYSKNGVVRIRPIDMAVFIAMDSVIEAAYRVSQNHYIQAARDKFENAMMELRMQYLQRRVMRRLKKSGNSNWMI